LQTVIQKVNDGSFKIYNNSDKHSMYKLLKHALDLHLIPAMKTHSGGEKVAFKFTRYEAENKELKEYKSKGWNFKCWHWSPWYFKTIIQRLAKKCEFVQTRSMLARTGHHHGILTIANPSVNFLHKIVTNTTCHLTNAVALYGRTDNAMHKLVPLFYRVSFISNEWWFFEHLFD